MAITTYEGWVADGKPFKQCQPALNLLRTLRRYGYTGPVSGYPDLRHQLADPPEDHCPYSHTPWPDGQPYPYGMAVDIIPGRGIDVIALGYRLVADKNYGLAGTEPIKYINWTDSRGQCWHDSWTPDHRHVPSSDRGHVHISFRTDFYLSGVMAGYDPLRGSMADQVEYDQYDRDRVTATNEAVARIELKLAELSEKIDALAPQTPGTFTVTGTLNLSNETVVP